MPPTPIVKKSAVRPRLDAVALIAAVAGFLLLAAIATSQPISGQPSPIGNAGEMTASPAVHSLGFASFTAIAGWLALTSLYIRRKSWPTYLIRGFGWAVLTGVSAVMADYASATAGGPYGAGGSI